MRIFPVLLFVFLGSAAAADFPAKPVRFITGANPGSTGDVLGRVLGDNLSTLWKQPVIVDNRPGGGGVIASQATLAASPDGHTVCICAGSYVTITPATTANMPYDVDKDFTPIAFVAEIPLVIGARPDLPYKSLPELIAYAKANPDRINYAANTPGTFPHLATEYFSQRAGIQMHFIPYKGSAPALADLMGGRLDLVVEGVAALGGAIKGGQLRALGVTSTRRDPTLPDVPALGETIPGFSAIGFYVVLAHAKTPEPLAAKLSDDFRQVLAKPDVAAKLAETGNYVRPMTRQEVAAFIKRERETWGAVIQKLGFAPR
ncbi:MAG: tripartite tricarboxylate transporter substrate binding protein [Betaproteobacteria bacterium]|nr:tripartite tricarboxylate transporter substrate binding protein [Betaproteobacteria bacterium]